MNNLVFSLDCPNWEIWRHSLVKDYKGIKQFNVNITYNSSWCLFHSSDILLRDRKSPDDNDAALAMEYSSSGSDAEMETEMADGTTR